MAVRTRNYGGTHVGMDLGAFSVSLNVADPFAYPGMKLQTTPKDNFPYEQLIFQKWNGGATGAWLGSLAWSRWSWSGVCAVGGAMALTGLIVLGLFSPRRPVT